MKANTLPVVVSIIVTTPALLFARWGSQGYGPGSCFGPDSSFFFPGGIPMILGTIILIVAGVITYKIFSKNVTGSSSLETLKMRYAKGEIDNETFHAMKEELNK